MPDPVRERIQGVTSGECGECGYPFDSGDWAWWSESMGHYYCGKACTGRAVDRAELRAEHGPWLLDW